MDWRDTQQSVITPRSVIITGNWSEMKMTRRRMRIWVVRRATATVISRWKSRDLVPIKWVEWVSAKWDSIIHLLTKLISAATKFQAENCRSVEAFPSRRARGWRETRPGSSQRRARSRRVVPRARIALMWRRWRVGPGHWQHLDRLHTEAFAEAIFQLQAGKRFGWVCRKRWKICWCVLIYCVKFALLHDFLAAIAKRWERGALNLLPAFQHHRSRIFYFVFVRSLAFQQKQY